MAAMPEARFVVLGEIVGVATSQKKEALLRRAQKLARERGATCRVEMWTTTLVADPPSKETAQ